MRNYLTDDPDSEIPESMLATKPGEYSSAELLNADRAKSFRMMLEIARVKQMLPGMDCGSCGAPTCDAFAEDVVKGEAKIEDCVIRMREQLKKTEQDGNV